MESDAKTTTAYAAVILYSSSSSSPNYQPLYEETVTVIIAQSQEHAEERARNFASTRETEYNNTYGETIRWRFERIVDIQSISDALEDTAEVYTRHFYDYDAYCKIAEPSDTDPES
jgi:hypothetical protein